MVYTRQGARTDPSHIRRRGYDSLYGNENERDPLTDIAFHLPAASTQSKKRESTGHQNDSAFQQAEVSLPEESGNQRPGDRPPPMEPPVAPNLYSDPAFLEYVVKAVAIGMIGGTSHLTSRSEKAINLV